MSGSQVKTKGKDKGKGSKVHADWICAFVLGKESLSRKPHPADFLCHLLGQNLIAWPPLTGHIAILNKTGICLKGRGRAWRCHRQPSVSATPSEPDSTLPFSGQLFNIVICVQMKGSVLVCIPLIERWGSIPLHCYHKWRGNMDYPLEKAKATHSSILAWRIPWTVQSIGSQRVGHDRATSTSLHFTSGAIWLCRWPGFESWLCHLLFISSATSVKSLLCSSVVSWIKWRWHGNT